VSSANVTRLLVVIASIAFIAWPHASNAQTSGLLLGVKVDSTYQTFWIAPARERLRLAAHMPGLIVPRADGFWRIDVVGTCFAAPGHPELIAHQDKLTLQRLNTNRLAVLDGDGFTELPEEQYLWNDCAAAETNLRTQRDLPKDAAVICASMRIALTSVSADHIVYEAATNVTELCSLDKQNAVERHARDYAGRRVERVPALPVPASEQRWKTQIKQRHPAYTDMFMSPNGSVVAAREHDGLFLYRPRLGKLGGADAQVRLPRRWSIVMVEWATGANVERWGRQLIQH
jgi:hypothetical protein